LNDPITEKKISDFIIEYIPDQPFEKCKLEIWFPSGDTKLYKSLEDLRQDIYIGRIRRNFQAKYSNNKNWLTINKISKNSSKIRNLFRPIYKSRNIGIYYGMIVGLIIKSLDTAYLLLQIDITSMFFFLITVGLFFLPFKVRGTSFIGIPVILLLSIVSKINLYSICFGCFLTGLLFGIPFGSAIGIIFGFYKAKRIGKIVDIEIENFSFYILGLILPIVFLLLAIPFWLFWLSPKFFEL